VGYHSGESIFHIACKVALEFNGVDRIRYLVMETMRGIMPSNTSVIVLNDDVERE
jgi:hypothetical protein